MHNPGRSWREAVRARDFKSSIDVSRAAPWVATTRTIVHTMRLRMAFQCDVISFQCYFGASMSVSAASVQWQSDDGALAIPDQDTAPWLHPGRGDSTPK